MLSALITGWVRRVALARGILDSPNERSSHVRPTPRGGGIAIVVVSLAAMTVLAWFGWIEAAPVLCSGGWRCGGRAGGSSRRPRTHRRRRAVHGAHCRRDLGDRMARRNDRDSLGRECDQAGLSGLATCGARDCLGAQSIQLHGWHRRHRRVAGDIHGRELAPRSRCLPECRTQTPRQGWSLPRQAWDSLPGTGRRHASSWATWAAAIWDSCWRSSRSPRCARSRHAARVADPGRVFFVDSAVTLLRRLARRERFYEAHRSHAYQWLARRWNSHLRVTLACLLLNLLWLAPWAWLCGAISRASRGWFVARGLGP